MTLTSVFFSRAQNGRHYPSFFFRTTFAIFSAFTTLEFDFAQTGKNITSENYWPVKTLVCSCAILIVECIYCIHLWCAFRFGRERNFLKVALHQFLLGVVVIRLLIWLVLTKWLGVTYLSFTESLVGHNGRSTAMVMEFLMITNITFFSFYLYLPQILFATSRKNTKDILVFHLGSVEKINLSEVLCIIHVHGTNVLITELPRARKLVSRESLEVIFSTLPPDKFELREQGIFKKGLEDGKPEGIEGKLWEFANKFYPGIYPM